MITLDGVQYQYKMTDCAPCIVLHDTNGWCAVSVCRRVDLAKLRKALASLREEAQEGSVWT